ncbi:MAG: hypothetical protein ABJQ14_00805, partial [Hyphomicrobiales bacterium]
IGNTASGLGGAIQINEHGELNITGVTFESNEATVGGAIQITSTQDTESEFRSCFFHGNRAGDGGAMNLFTGTGVDGIFASTFRNNFAGTPTDALHLIPQCSLLSRAGRYM